MNEGRGLTQARGTPMPVMTEEGKKRWTWTYTGQRHTDASHLGEERAMKQAWTYKRREGALPAGATAS